MMGRAFSSLITMIRGNNRSPCCSFPTFPRVLFLGMTESKVFLREFFRDKKKGNFEKFPYYRGFAWLLCTYFVSFLDIIVTSVTSKLKISCGDFALLKLDFYFYFCLNVCFFNFSWILLLRKGCYFFKL